MVVKSLAKPRNLRAAGIILLLALLIVGATALYIYSRTYANANRLGVPMHPAAFDSIMARILPAMQSMIGASIVLAVVSLSFQTVVRSRVLTPSMIGFDSIFVGTQTVLVFVFGAYSVWFQNPYVNYFVTAGIMITISMFMYSFILRSSKNNVIFLLMFGLILSGIIGSGTRYLQVIMNQSEFFHVQAATMVNVNNINTSIANIAFPIMAVVVALIVMRHRRLDVMSLGADQAKSLGIAYERELRLHLILIAVGMSIATALIGSLTFLGLLAVNAAREIMKTHKHLPLFIGSALMAALTLIAGQAVMELLQGAVPVTVIINLVGCAYIFYLVLKENKA